VQAHADLELLRRKRLESVVDFEPIDGYSTLQLTMFHKLFEAYGRKKKRKVGAPHQMDIPDDLKAMAQLSLKNVVKNNQIKQAPTTVFNAKIIQMSSNQKKLNNSNTNVLPRFRKSVYNLGLVLPERTGQENEAGKTEKKVNKIMPESKFVLEKPIHNPLYSTKQPDLNQFKSDESAKHVQNKIKQQNIVQSEEKPKEKLKIIELQPIIPVQESTMALGQSTGSYLKKKKKLARGASKRNLTSKVQNKSPKIEQDITIPEKKESEQDNQEVKMGEFPNMEGVELFSNNLFGLGDSDGAYELKTTTLKKKCIFVNPIHPLQKSRVNVISEMRGIEDENDIDELIEEGFTNHIKTLFGLNRPAANVFEEILQLNDYQKKELKKEMNIETLLAQNKKMEKYFKSQYEFLMHKPGDYSDKPKPKLASEILKFSYYFSQELSDNRQTNTERLDEAIKLHSAMYANQVNRRRHPFGHNNNRSQDESSK
jgi:hypothetical protein